MISRRDLRLTLDDEEEDQGGEEEDVNVGMEKGKEKRSKRSKRGSTQTDGKQGRRDRGIDLSRLSRDLDVHQS